MYTMLPIDESCNAVRFMTEKALKFASVTYFKSPESDFKSILFVKKDFQHHSSWIKGTPNRKSLWGFDDAMEAMELITQNSVFYNCFGLVRQTIGVGMGSEPSGPIANLALAYKELLWVQAQTATLGPQQISVKFNNFQGYARYIDDLGTSNHEIPSAHDYYDMPLILTGSTDTSQTVEFLSFVFHKEHFLPISATIKDKQNSFPIQLLRYPGHMSTISNECKVGCVIAGLTTIFRCIDSPIVFQSEIGPFFDRLRLRRFTFDIIRDGCKKFINRNVKPMFTSFFWTFFQPHLDSWPFHTDVSANIADIEDAIRRNPADTFFPSWHSRQDLLHPAQITAYDLPVNRIQEQSTTLQLRPLHSHLQLPHAQNSPEPSLYSFPSARSSSRPELQSQRSTVSELSQSYPQNTPPRHDHRSQHSSSTTVQPTPNRLDLL